jgi:WD40 repeat protein
MNETARRTLLAIALFFPLLLFSEASERGERKVDAAGSPLPEGARFRFGDVRWRHGAYISASAMSPDGNSLATASKGSVVVWDARTGERLHEFPFNPGSRLATPGLAFSPDGKHLGYVPNYELACVWDLRTGKEVIRVTKDWRAGHSLCHFTPDGKEFAVVDQNRVAFWDLASAKETRSIPIEHASLLSPDATTYLRVPGEKSLVLGDARTGKEKARWDVATSQDGVRNGLAFSPDGKTLAVVHQNKEIQIRTPPAPAVLRTIPLPDTAKFHHSGHNYWEYLVGFSPDGQTLHLATLSGTVHRWDLATGKELPTLTKHLSRAVGYHPLPDGKTVLTTGGDGLIRRWDGKTGRELSKPPSYQGRTRAAYSPDGRFVAVGDAGGRLDLFDARTGKRLHALRDKGAAVNNLAFAPDGRSLAAGLHSGEVRYWEVPSESEGKARRRAGEPGWGFASTMSFSPDGRHLFVANYPHRVGLFEVATGREVWRGPISTAAAFTANGAQLAVALGGPRLTILNAATGKELAKVPLNTSARENFFNAVDSLAISPDGTRLAVALYDGKVSLCDVRDGEETRQFPAVGPPEGKFAGISLRDSNRAVVVAFSPDGRWLLSGCDDGHVRVWEVATGAEVLRRTGHEGGVLDVAIGPDGRTALSSGNDGQAYLWDLRPAPLPTGPETMWDDLGSGDPRKAYRAVWALSEADGGAQWLREKLAPSKPADPERMKKLIDDLNSDTFKVRADATRALAELGRLAGPAMEASLKKKPALETEQRLRKLLGALKQEPAPAELHQTRAVQAMELADTPEARDVLRAWAGGAPGARLTEDARAALARLEKRASTP